MTAELTAADMLWGPIALVINLLEHGFPPDSIDGAAELIAGGVGTVLWASIVGAIANLR